MDRVLEVGQGGELGTVIRQDGVDLVGHCGHEGAREVGGNLAGGLLMPLGKSKRADPIDDRKEIPAACFRVPFGPVEMEIAERLFLKFRSGGLAAFHLRRAFGPIQASCPEFRVLHSPASD